MWCWWCCHPFESKSLSMPISYNEKTDTFKVYGHFCSFSCMKAYNHHENIAQKANQYALISCMIAKTFKKPININCAPPRQLLNVFGGHMTIDEFRACGKNGVIYNLHTPPMIPVNHIIEKQQSNFKWIKSLDESNDKSYSMQEFEEQACSNKIANNPIKIKPGTTKKKKVNTLEMVLGIVPNSN